MAKKIEKNSNSSATSTQANSQGDGTAEVLYQRLGDRWFAFSVIDDEVFVGSVTHEEIHGNASSQDTFKITGNS
jgi:hypothetical protein